ncbi:hypothetical protein [Sphingomonas hengshuiensis]|uniref:hypothetical protein n=1 Tax=Sphingomonas hengshuiensis TaxID=1609977 RepID=UPI000A460A1E|nr:hypothetical protein [Sphingomonas hengshuiensis]
MTNPPLLQGCSQSAGKGHNRLPGQQEGGWAPRPCPECLKLFEPKVRNQLFCTPQHNAAWNNRATARGRVLTPLGMAARVTRNGTQGAPELREAGRVTRNAYNTLLRNYRDEDREAGRMPWAQYMLLRLKLGYEPLR